MKKPTSHNVRAKLALVIVVLVLALPSFAQTEEERAAVRATGNALALFKAQRFAEAIPHFETAIKSLPEVDMLRFMYGFCLVAKSKQISDQEEAKKLSQQALEQFKKAKELGLQSEDNEAMIRLLEGGSAGHFEAKAQYSENAQAEKLMNEGESFFAQSQYDEAIKRFAKALELDPKIYQAGTSGGDSYVAKSDFENAEKWYQKAIAIDPNRETAWRYSATPLMKQKKYDQARERYIEAFIVEPYNSMSSRGINQWAEVVGKNLGHPEVKVPEFQMDENGLAVPKVLIADTDAELSPWKAYFAVREIWIKEKFGKTFPNAKGYRHTLSEEVEALRAAVKSAQEKKAKAKHFETLAKLDTDGLLEAYVLLGRPDRGIAADHAEYLKTNRPKLRKYVADYVIQ
jgi:tetratricopeptide (TPR) repeat protein